MMLIFWIAVLLFGLGAAACLFLPFRSTPISDDLPNFERKFYQARISEIEQDLKLGRIEPDAAKIALAEQGRKLLATANQSPIAGPTSFLKFNSKFIAMFSVLIPTIAIVIYLKIGQPDLVEFSHQHAISTGVEQTNITELIKRAEAHLEANPTDGKGWSALAPIYSRLNQNDKAVFAWRKTKELQPDFANIDGKLAEAIISQANGKISQEALSLFQAEQSRYPDAKKPRFFLAMYLGQQARHREAIVAWQSLINSLEEGSPLLQISRDFQARSVAIVSGQANTGAGPTLEDMQAAAELSPTDRKQMIRSMVDGLAQKLAEDPSSRANWKRLVRSYVVLGEKENARAAIKEATSAHENDADFANELNQILAGNS